MRQAGDHQITIMAISEDRIAEKDPGNGSAAKGLWTLSAASEGEALGVVEQEIPDLILLDVIMSGLNRDRGGESEQAHCAGL